MATEIMYAVEPEKKRSYKTIWFLSKYHSDDDYKKYQQNYINEWTKNKYHNDEEYRKQISVYKKQYYQRKKAEKALKSANSP